VASAEVSSAVSAPPAAPAPRRGRGGRLIAALRRPSSRSAAASLALGLALAAAAFVAEGGNEIGGTTLVTIAAILAGGAVAAAAVPLAPAGRAWGAGTLVLLVALVALTALSVIWSVSPEQSWFHANKSLGYLFAFAGALAAVRLAPGGWPVVLRGILLGAGIVVAYALLSRVFPGSLAADEIYARIGAPYGYWNAVGTTAALAVVPALWLGARRSGYLPANALAYPLLGLLVVALFLSYSRGALAAAAVGAALWLAFVPLRLRSLAVLGLAAAGAAPVILWALDQDAFTEDGVQLAVREAAAAGFGLLLVAMVLVLLAAGLAVGFANARRAPSRLLRRRAGIAALALAALLPVAGLVALAGGERGIGGTWDDLTSEEAVVTGGPERLTSAGSSRARYWREAFDIFEDNLLKGAGADSFRTARLPYRKDVLVSSHAHGYVAQTAADLGLLGLGASALLLLAWLWAAGRTLAVRDRLRRVPWDAERVGLSALALAAVVFGLHSALDWTWFVPAPALMALLAAAWVAGRGPVEERPPAAGPRPLASLPRPRLAAAALVALAALACAWTAWQPERSQSAGDEALALLEDGELARAAREADRARDLNPLSPRPLFIKAQIQDRAGNRAAAEATLEQAVREHPARADVWLRLAEYQLLDRDDPEAALQTLRAALYLDPRSRQAQAAFFEARSRLREQEAERARERRAG
jgi:tetratricopeptide (TPR) repeat protein